MNFKQIHRTRRNIYRYYLQYLCLQMRMMHPETARAASLTTRVSRTTTTRERRAAERMTVTRRSSREGTGGNPAPVTPWYPSAGNQNQPLFIAHHSYKQCVINLTWTRSRSLSNLALFNTLEAASGWYQNEDVGRLSCIVLQLSTTLFPDGKNDFLQLSTFSQWWIHSDWDIKSWKLPLILFLHSALGMDELILFNWWLQKINESPLTFSEAWMR